MEKEVKKRDFLPFLFFFFFFGRIISKGLKFLDYAYVGVKNQH